MPVVAERGRPGGAPLEAAAGVVTAAADQSGPRPCRGPRPLALYLRLATLAARADTAAAGRGRHASPVDLTRFVNGLRAYWEHSYCRPASRPPIIWTSGSARLVDHGDPHGWPVLIVPSLVNRAYILDLDGSRSLIRHLVDTGYRPILLDWGQPQGTELSLTLADQIFARAAAALDATLAVAGRPPVLLGYCMGGLVACALAQARSADLAGLGLLATPWDFAAGRAGTAPLLASGLLPLTLGIATMGQAPVDLLQAFFGLLDPWRVIDKFQRFADLPPDSAEAERFVAVEDWLNDGVPLAGPVAQECLWHWYVENRPGRGIWAPGGELVQPERLALPSFVAIPRRDRIVTAASAEALARRLPQATVVRPMAGHISMLIGKAAPVQLWRPFTEWLRRIAPSRSPRAMRPASAT